MRVLENLFLALVFSACYDHGVDIVYGALGVMGGAGALSLIQSKSLLPSEADYKKAQDKLSTAPEDPDANTISGKYVAFVLGDFPAGCSFLAKSSDKTLKSLADHELDSGYTATAIQKVGMGDEWVAAAKNCPALFRIFYDRAGYWYGLAWPNLEGPWKIKTRERAFKLGASRPPGNRKGLPKGWQSDLGTLDGSLAHTGSYSLKLPATTQNKLYSWITSDPVLLSGKTMEMSAYVFTDGTENPQDKLRIEYFDARGANFGGDGPFVNPDVPFWTRFYMKVDLPQNISRGVFKVFCYSKMGNLWVDDISLKVDGKELLKNTSFELP